MKHAKIENGEITEITTNLRAEFPNTSFPSGLPDTHEGWSKVTRTMISPPEGKKYQSTSINLVDGVPTEVHAYVSFDDAELLEHLSNYRFVKEEGGITIGGVQVQTDRTSRADLIGARTLAKENNSFAVKWKTKSGSFVDLDAATIITLADAVAAHVQKCFAAEATVIDSLDDYSTFAEVEAAFDTAYSA